MKKILTLLLVFTIGIFSTGCTKQVVFIDKTVDQTRLSFDNFVKTTGYSYPFIRKEEWSDEEIGKIRKKSISFCNKLRAKNIAILYDPMLQIGEEDS